MAVFHIRLVSFLWLLAVWRGLLVAWLVFLTGFLDEIPGRLSDHAGLPVGWVCCRASWLYDWLGLLAFWLAEWLGLLDD
jgi:hypothetical protein